MLNCPSCMSEAQLWSRAKDIEYDSVEDTFNYLYCQNCDLIFIENPPANRLSEIYPKNYYSFDGNVKSLLIRIKMGFDRIWFGRQFSKHLVGEPKRILDLGGGAGYHAKLIQDLYPEAIATIVDFDSNSISLSQRDRTSFVECDLNSSFPDGRYDVIIAWNILEHILKPENFLASCRNSLTKEGILLLQTPNFRTLSAQIFNKSYWGGLHSPRHFTLFSKSSLRSYLDRAGLQIIDFKYVQGAHFWSVSIVNRLGFRAIRNSSSILDYKIYKFFLLFFACVDLILAKVSKTGQMYVAAGQKPLNTL